MKTEKEYKGRVMDIDCYPFINDKKMYVITFRTGKLNVITSYPLNISKSSIISFKCKKIGDYYFGYEVKVIKTNKPQKQTRNQKFINKMKNEII